MSDIGDGLSVRGLAEGGGAPDVAGGAPGAGGRAAAARRETGAWVSGRAVVDECGGAPGP